MIEWFDRVARLVALAERVSTLTEAVKSLSSKVENHNERLVRLETIVEITRPDGGVLRINRDQTSG